MLEIDQVRHFIYCYVYVYIGIECSYYFVLSAVYYPGESSFEVKIEADSNDINDVKPTIESRG